MEDELHKRIVGMDDAIKALSQAIRRTRAGLKDPRRPGGSFIFAGPTGVGKTELAKTLAEFLFGDEDALIQLDMSRVLREAHRLAAVRLASRLRRLRGGRPAHREGAPQAVLRRALRRGREGPPRHLQLAAADPRGRPPHRLARVAMVDFKNTVIIMTTNLGTRDISKGVARLRGRPRHPDRLRPDEGQGQRRAQAALPARVPQPRRRHHRLPAADPGRDRRRSST